MIVTQPRPRPKIRPAATAMGESGTINICASTMAAAKSATPSQSSCRKKSCDELSQFMRADMGHVSLPEDSSFATVSRISAHFSWRSHLSSRIHISNEPDLVVVFPNAMAAGKSFLAQSRRISIMGSVVNRDRILSMKSRTLLATGIVVLFVAAIWWRQSAQEATIAELQRRLANVPAAPTNEVVRTAVPDYRRPAAQPVEEFSDDSAARLAQLEGGADCPA